MKSVFLNCPYDPAFEPYFLAAALAISCHGFEPRAALESEGSSEPRLPRIVKAISESSLSIHDLSRYNGEAAGNLARFNMPLELGIAIGIQRCFKSNRAGDHEWFVMYQGGSAGPPPFLSDLHGYDNVGRHEMTTDSVIREVSWWLKRHEGAAQPPAKYSLQLFEPFQRRVQELRDGELGKLMWKHVVDAASDAAARLRESR